MTGAHNPEVAPTSDEVEAMAKYAEQASPECAAMLRSLSRQVAAKDAEIARDAARYRHLCDLSGEQYVNLLAAQMSGSLGDAIDVLIDAAMGLK
jgi:DNA-binding FadR family transcriptional regulator